MQRRATKFILGLLFRTDIPYKRRLATLKMLPLCYWHEYLDVLFLFKCSRGLIKADILPEQVVNPNRSLHSNNSHLITYNIHKVRTLCHQNSFVTQVSRIWNTLPDELRDLDICFLSFKSRLLSYYHSATQTLFDEDKPQTWKSVCVKCHKARQLNTMNNCCF